MARTTEEAVRAIIELDDDFDLDPFIEPANALVTARCAPLAYSAAQLELIERWLSAHFCTVLDPRTIQEQAGSVQASYQSKVDLGLYTSHYGQHALVLDFLGGLANLGEKDRVKTSLTWLGSND